MEDEEKNVKFLTSDGKDFDINSKIYKMIPKLPNIPIITLDNVSSFTLDAFKRYCEGHNYEPYHKEIRRPLNDDLSLCIENAFDYEFVKQFDLDALVILLNETYQFECAGFIELLLSKLALLFRNMKYEDLLKTFKVNQNIFNEELISQIISENNSLMMIEDDRVKELLNDDI